MWLQTRKKRSTKRRGPQRAFQRGKIKSKQYTSSRYTRFRERGPKYSAVQQKTCDVSCYRHRVFSFPVIYSGYVAGRSATYTESKRSRSQYRRLYCCLNGNTGLKAFLYVAFEWEKGILGVWEVRRIPLPSHAQIPFSDLSNVCQQARGLLLTALTTTFIC